MNLYSRNADLEEFENALLEAGGEFDEEGQGALLEATFEKLQGDLDAKLDSYCALIRNAEARAKVRDAEARIQKEEGQRLAQLVSTDENLVRRLKAVLLWFMRRRELGKRQTPRFTIWRQAGGGKAPIIVPPAWLANAVWAPERFRKVTITLDLDAIRQELDAGNTLCPVCGEAVGFDSVEEDTSEPLVIACVRCQWQGSLEMLVRFGERPEQVRIK